MQSSSFPALLRPPAPNSAGESFTFGCETGPGEGAVRTPQNWGQGGFSGVPVVRVLIREQLFHLIDVRDKFGALVLRKRRKVLRGR